MRRARSAPGRASPGTRRCCCEDDGPYGKSGIQLGLALSPSLVSHRAGQQLAEHLPAHAGIARPRVPEFSLHRQASSRR